MKGRSVKNMHYFYLPNFESHSCFLTEEDSRHCIKVLRLKSGEEIGILDGKGFKAKAILTNQNPKKSEFRILEKNYAPLFPCTIHIAIAPPKNIERLEWFLEKTTEIGITEITPVITLRSERKKLNIERLEKVIISALKQSQNPFKPKLNQTTDFSGFIKQSNDDAQKLIAHFKKNNPHCKEVYVKGKNVLILIGPEGDFDEKEITLAMDNGYNLINLSQNRLRTETAGITACMIFNLLNT